MTIEARETIQCVHCGGDIRAAAKICKHCTRPVGAMPASQSAASPPAWTTAEPLPVLAELRTFVVQRGLLRREQVDLVLNATPGVDAGVALGHLAAAGYITPAQADTMRSAFWQHQGQRARAVLNATVQRGLLTPAHAQAATSQYESVALQQTIGDFLVATQLLTAAQAAEFSDTRSPIDRMDVGAQWSALPGTVRGAILAVPAVAVLLAVAFAVRGSPDVHAGTVMDGFGRGTATFTNRGRRAGASCGHVLVVCGRGNRSSVSFCSGIVPPGEMRQQEFRVLDMDRIITGRRTWTDECEFEFVPEATEN
jgi:hypothetical protein